MHYPLFSPEILVALTWYTATLEHWEGSVGTITRFMTTKAKAGTTRHRTI